MPGGVAPKFGSEKVSRYTGVSQLQLRVSRYTVQLRAAKGVLWAKSTNKYGRQTSKRTASVLRLRRLAPGGVFIAWILGHSWLPSGHGQGSLAEMHLRSLSCCRWQAYQTLLLVKGVSFEKMAQTNRKIRHETLPAPAAQFFFWNFGVPRDICLKF